MVERDSRNPPPLPLYRPHPLQPPSIPRITLRCIRTQIDCRIIIENTRLNSLLFSLCLSLSLSSSFSILFFPFGLFFLFLSLSLFFCNSVGFGESVEIKKKKKRKKFRMKNEQWKRNKNSMNLFLMKFNNLKKLFFWKFLKKKWKGIK